MQRTKTLICLTILSSVMTSFTLAHGPQLQVTTAGGKLVTNAVFADQDPVLGYGPVSDPKRVYVMPLTNSLGDGQYFARPNTEASYYSGPGFAYGFADLEIGSQIELKFLEGLLHWDGATFVDPGTEQLQAFRGSHLAPSSSIVTVDGGVSAGLIAVPSFAPGASAHATARFRILGDGVSSTAASADGVYLATMQLSSNSAAPVVENSDPYFFLLHKNATQTDIDAALAALLSSQGIDSSLVQVVPEPGSVALAAIGGTICAAAMLRRWRRS